MPPADPDIPRTPVPPLPEGIATLREFGHQLMRWGTGEEARARIDTLTVEELVAHHMTLELAVAWRDFYENEARRNPANQSAGPRADLMAHAVRLLEEEGQHAE
jgi:hypothetical protein